MCKDLKRFQMSLTLLRTPGTILLAALLLFVSSPQLAADDTVTDSVRVYFRQGKSNFEPAFQGNGPRIDSLIARIRQMQGSSIVDMKNIRVQATASPEATYQINDRLAERRAGTIADYLSKYARFDRSSLKVDFIETDWQLLEDMVDASDWELKDRALELIRANHDDKALKRADTRIYNYLYNNFYPRMRGTTVYIRYSMNMPELEDQFKPWPEEPIDFGDEFAPLPIEPLGLQPMALRQSEPEPVEPETLGHWYLKTNFLTWPLNLTPNIGFEFEIGRHFSVSIPFYYSALDWFRRDRKFRVAGIQPEGRYWFREGFLGPFVGVHGTFGWWNIAAGDGYRYQDHNGKNPTFGGGIQAGWKIPVFTKSKHPDRWGLEFVLGAGYMPLYSDKYYDVYNGMKVGEIHKNYWGIDHAAVSLTYKIDYKRRKR